MSSIMFCASHQILSGWYNREGHVTRSGGSTNPQRILMWISKGDNHLEDFSVHHTKINLKNIIR